MQIKKFVGATMKEATDRMKTELGSDAIVLNTRKVSTNRFLNFLGKDLLEITAAIDDRPVPTGRQAAKNMDKFSYAFRQAREAYSGNITQPKTAVDELNAVVQKASERRLVGEESSRVSLSKSNTEVEMLKNEMEEMRGVLSQIADHLKYAKMPALPVHLQQAFINLVNNEVEETIAADIIQAVYGRLNEDQLEEKETVEKGLLAEIAKYFHTTPIPKEKTKRVRVVALVGPTGVGKTTTIAKLAAIHKLLHHQNVGLITADTYRIGAIEQLRTFAGIADIPMQVVYKPTEIPEALKTFRKKDIVFIDTVGRSQHAKKELAELRRYLDAAAPDEIHLVLNASSGRNTLLDVVERFKTFKPNRLLVTKIDEALSLGGLLSVVKKYDLPISYLTTGQVVPDDITAVEPIRLAGMINNGAVAHA
jgi:flagellar biosynthesis protein FlhF